MSPLELWVGSLAETLTPHKAAFSKIHSGQMFKKVPYCISAHEGDSLLWIYSHADLTSFEQVLDTRASSDFVAVFYT